MQVRKIGTTEEGRDLSIVIVASDASMRELDTHRGNAARLADPRKTSREEANRLIASTKPIYYLAGGLHSSEMGSPEMLMELAYRLVTSDDPRIARIRENVIVVINPVAEPDGRDKLVDWYYRYTKARTEWEDGFPRSAPYWGRYIYHDNNRDGLQISAQLTKAFFDTYYEWHPVVMLDLHESVPLLYISTGTGPYNETIDPITIGEWQVLANHDLTSVTAEGMPGVFTWAFYDGWYPGYALWVANNHNSIGRFYETFGNAGANTYIRDLTDSRFAGDSVISRQWYRPLPATRKVRWSARDNVNYMQSGVLASLQYAADNGQQLLRNFYQKGVNNIERGLRSAPHAFVIPRYDKQRDPRRVAYLVNQLQRQGIEVQQRTDGDFVVLLNQPYRNHAVTLLTKQNFPSNAPNAPYDDVAWTLGYIYGVDVQAVNDSAVFKWSGLKLLTDTVAYNGTATSGSGTTWVSSTRRRPRCCLRCTGCGKTRGMYARRRCMSSWSKAATPCRPDPSCSRTHHGVWQSRLPHVSASTCAHARERPRVRAQSSCHALPFTTRGTARRMKVGCATRSSSLAFPIRRFTRMMHAAGICANALMSSCFPARVAVLKRSCTSTTPSTGPCRIRRRRSSRRTERPRRPTT